MKTTAQSWISGPRWAGGRKILEDTAWKTGVALDILDHNKGWLFEKVEYVITGEIGAVLDFTQAVRKQVKTYNEAW
jgi:hypothetical protein